MIFGIILIIGLLTLFWCILSLLKVKWVSKIQHEHNNRVYTYLILKIDVMKKNKDLLGMDALDYDYYHSSLTSFNDMMVFNRLRDFDLKNYINPEKKEIFTELWNIDPKIVKEKVDLIGKS